MAFLAPLVATAGQRSLRKVLPWLLASVIILILAMATWMQTYRLQAARAALQAVHQQIELGQQDVLRWQVAAAERDHVIRDQAAQLTRLRADEARAQQVADEAAAAHQREIADLDKRLRQMQARAYAHPDQVRPLGPIAIDVLDSLHSKPAGTGADPAGD